MAAVELPAITKAGNGPVPSSEGATRTRERTSRYKKAYSEDIPSLREEEDNEDGEDDEDGADRGRLQRSASERRTPDSQNTTQPITTNTNRHTDNNRYSNPRLSSADNRQSSGQEAHCPDNVRSDIYPSDSTTQNSSIQREKLAAAAAAKDTEEMTKQEEEDEEHEETMQICPCCPCCPPVRTYPPSSLAAREKGGFVNWLKLILRWIIFIPAFPFVCLFSWTIPECSKEHLRKYYLLSFFMSVAWIAALSYAMVTVVERTGCILGVDSYIMGLVVVAIGTSVPDAMSSILVARDGYGDMAVSNAIGSNVFDINLGLGLPFIIRIAIDKGAPIALLESSEWVAHYSGKMVMTPHSKFGFILLVILFLCLIIFIAVRFRLNKWIGITFLIMYIIFLVYAFTQELYCARKLGIYC